jgi:transposase
MMPHDLPPWNTVYQQTQRWLKAGCFEAIAHDLRMLLRMAAGREPTPTAAILDSRTLQSTPESGSRTAYDGAKRRKGSKAHLAVDTLGHLGIDLIVVKHTEAKRGFVLLPRRWVVERSFGWMARFRRLARDYERLASTLVGLHFVAFVCLMLSKAGLMME